MEQLQKIRIAKRLCTTIKTPFRAGIEVQMLPTSQYAGYKFFVADWRVESHTTFFEILQSPESEWLFTLEKTERESGKRYARPKLTYKELQAEFADHSAQFYSDALPQALAYIKTYADDGTRNAGRVMASEFCIGGYDKTWFYQTIDHRRRLNTRGVRILKRLAPEEVESMKAKLARFYRLKKSTQCHEDCLIKGNEFFIQKGEETLGAEALKMVKAKVVEINQVISEECAAMRAELAELEEYFNAFMES